MFGQSNSTELWRIPYDETTATEFGLKGGYKSQHEEYRPRTIQYLCNGMYSYFDPKGIDTIRVLDSLGQVIDSVELGGE
jgi:hypothetical protein